MYITGEMPLLLPTRLPPPCMHPQRGHTGWFFFVFFFTLVTGPPPFMLQDLSLRPDVHVVFFSFSSSFLLSLQDLEGP